MKKNYNKRNLSSRYLHTYDRAHTYRQTPAITTVPRAFSQSKDAIHRDSQETTLVSMIREICSENTDERKTEKFEKNRKTRKRTTKRA